MPFISPSLFALFALGVSVGVPEVIFGASSAKESLEPKVVDWRQEVSDEIECTRKKLHALHQKALCELERGPLSVAMPSVEGARHLRAQLREHLEKWRTLAARDAADPNELSALWHFPEITLFQLLNEFGSQEHLYLIPHELSAMKITVLSGFALPKQTWPDLIEWILAERGLATCSINPLCRKVYRIADEPLALEAIVTERRELARLAPQTRVCYLHPLSESAQSLRPIFDQFASQSSLTRKYLLGQVALIGRCCDLAQLLTLCDAVTRDGEQRTYRVLPLAKCCASDALAALRAAGFIGEDGGKDAPFANGAVSSSPLQAIALSHPPHLCDRGILLFGNCEQIERACHMIQEIEGQLARSTGRQLLWYLCKHEKPPVLARLAAELLEMLEEDGGKGDLSEARLPRSLSDPLQVSQLETPDPKEVDAGKAQMAEDGARTCLSSEFRGAGRIAVDAKSGYLVLAIPPHLESPLRAALERFDRPKHMVQIDFLLIERKIADTNRSGIQLLRLGAHAAQTSEWGADFSRSASGNEPSRGILDFFIHHAGGRGYLPPYDLAYQFLIAQENVQIDANPSILTINGVPAYLDLVDETSINTGAVKGDREERFPQNAYVRAKYGIKIAITPYVQFEGDARYITLDTNVSFDTRKGSQVSRPDVTTRRIKTLVRVGDGQSVILGGLKQKDVAAHKESVPLLGELPGIGKLFGSTVLIDKTTEMFLFITPKIVSPELAENDAAEVRALMSRPNEGGDIAQKLQMVQKNLPSSKVSSEFEQINSS